MAALFQLPGENFVEAAELSRRWEVICVLQWRFRHELDNIFGRLGRCCLGRTLVSGSSLAV